MFPLTDTAGLNSVTHIPVSYTHLSKEITEADIKLFQEGMILKDGFKTKPACLTRLAPRLAEVRIREGRYHQVKRMFACSGNSVLSLKRISIGGLTLDKELEPGEVRPLLKSEINKICLLYTSRCV